MERPTEEVNRISGLRNETRRIVYGSGRVIATGNVVEAAVKLFERPEIAYIHLRSATNNCYQCRIDRS